MTAATPSSSAAAGTPVAPVLFVVFNRPKPTAKVFEAIRAARPAKLYVAADGPRSSRPGEAERCAEVRRIATNVDWPCELHTLFREQNLGCGPSVSSALNWFFSEVGEGMVLEDDVYPDPTFFRFCSELLAYYRHDERVMLVSASNLLQEMPQRSAYSYFFSNHDYIWGWASWARAWKNYDYRMSRYPYVMDGGYFDSYHNSIYETEYLKRMYDQGFYNRGNVSFWSYQWTFSRRINSGVVAVSLRNLVVNLGLGGEGTHTQQEKGLGYDLKLEQAEFPLRHPPHMMINQVLDDKVFKKYFTTPWARVKSRVKYTVPGSAHVYHMLKNMWLGRFGHNAF